MLRAIGILIFLSYALFRISRTAMSDGYMTRVDRVQDRDGQWYERHVQIQRYSKAEIWAARLFLVVLVCAVCFGTWEWRGLFFPQYFH